jgi:hypothetical protein
MPKIVGRQGRGRADVALEKPFDLETLLSEVEALVKTGRRNRPEVTTG